MAAPANTVTTYTAVGIREDLENAIYDISPTDYPFYSNVAMDTAQATYCEWQTDKLRQPKQNATISGDDVTNDVRAPTVRPGNYTQLSDEVVGVSSTQRAVNTAGREDELSYQMAKALEEVKRDIEFCATQNHASNAGDGSTARVSASTESWISTNASHGATGSTPGFSAGTVAAPTDGTQREYTSTLLDDAIEGAWNEGGSPEMILLGGKLKRKNSTFSGIATRFRDAPPGAQAEIIGGADSYVSDFGFNQVITPSRWVRDRTVQVLDPALWAIAYLQAVQSQPLAKTGHSDREMIFAEWTLKARNEAGNAKVSDLDPAA